MSGSRAVRVAGLFDRDENGLAYLRGSCCERCAEHVFPSRVVCPRCRLSTMRPVRLGREGTLFSFTVAHVAPEGWKAPYLQAFVELSEGPRVFTLISDEIQPRIDALELGQPMELVIEPQTEARPELTYKFRPRPTATRAKVSVGDA
jgi:uncharacterized OB-fold protein